MKYYAIYAQCVLIDTLKGPLNVYSNILTIYLSHQVILPELFTHREYFFI